MKNTHTAIVGTRIPIELIKRLQQRAGKGGVSAYIRRLLEAALATDGNV